MIDFSLFEDPEFFATEFIIENKVLRSMTNGRAKWETIQSLAKGIIQPISGKERELLPEGEAQKEGLTIYTTSELFIGSEKTRASCIVYRNKKYRVKNLEEWGMGSQKYYKAVALLENDEENNEASRE